MRPRALWHRSRHLQSLFGPRGTFGFPFSSSTCLLYPRNNRVRGENVRTQRISSAAGHSPSEDGSNPEIGDSPRKSTRAFPKIPKTREGALDPEGISDVHTTLWHGFNEADHGKCGENDASDHSGATGLPEPWLLQEAYENLLLTLHPQTQHNATYHSGEGVLIEPTLALYCPIEGGEYVIDATVREIATRAGADVVVIDALDLAAGEHGKYGKSASVLHFHQNPLQHSPTPTYSATPLGRQIWSNDEQDEEDGDEGLGLPVTFGEPQAFTIQIPIGVQSGGSTSFRAARNSGSSVSTAPLAEGGPKLQQIRTFFDEVINIGQPASTKNSEGSDARKHSQVPPRLVYIKDFSLIASQPSSWYPALLAAVRNRRQNGGFRPTSPISRPTTIIFGITPPLVDRPSPSLTRPPGPRSIMAMFSGIRSTSAKQSPSESWSEGDSNSRERRLRERLRKWQKGENWLRSELPFFGEASLHPKRPKIVRVPNLRSFMDGGFRPIPMGTNSPLNAGHINSGVAGKDGYFRVVGLVPASRDHTMEATGRYSRRLQYNEAAFKMAVADAGGLLKGHTTLSSNSTEAEPSVSALAVAWTQSLEPWRELKATADAVVGSRLSSVGIQESESLKPLVVTWSDVEQMRSGEPDIHQLKRNWIESSAPALTDEESMKASGNSVGATGDVDEVLESVKRDQDLDQHEQRLLGCIVDSATMPTTFKSVHLPPATIDSVRTIVSLPLLHPEAFSTGILKTHSMNGVLLFGPPGTGKTLLARAICKESGARMMLIKPSDVMDMYVGEGEKLVRSVFTLARRLSPCVVFLDEIDALFGHRVSSRDGGSAMAHRGVITEFMQEMDGLKSSRDQSVIVIGATNRPFDLDDAVLRRLPRRLLIDLPGPAEREEILKILLRDEEVSSDVDLAALAKRTDAFSGSDLKHLCIAAALDAVKENVDVPWAVPSKPLASSIKSETDQILPDMKVVEPSPTAHQANPESEEKDTILRMLSSRHFNKALREITPSASEALGTLVAIRKWNEEFGEGSKGRRRRAWGDRFGFSAIDTTPGDHIQLNTVETRRS